jgi:hypothetical protein
MERHEEAVLDYICADQSRFVHTQFNFTWDKNKGEGGSCPDFVVIDYQDRVIYVVEVTIASNVNKLIQKMMDREKLWIEPLKKHLNEINNNGFSDWEYHVTAFVREINIPKFKKEIKDASDISVIGIESISFLYQPDLWESKTPKVPLKLNKTARSV